MKKKQAPTWSYGQSPNPTNWHEAAEALKSVNKSGTKPRSNPLAEKLNTIEQLLKDHK